MKTKSAFTAIRRLTRWANARRALALGLFALVTAPAFAAPQPPNIVFFLVDDLGWTDLGVQGSDLYQTPHIDRLAREGMRFSNAYSACTVCSPTRAAIMTGRYPATLRITDWIAGHKRPFAKLQIPDWTMALSTNHYTLAEALRDAGYATAHVGKWHLGETADYWPEHQGFDVNLGGWSVGAPQKKDGANGYFSPYGNPRLSDGPEGEYLEERLAREACAFMERNKDRPFFLNYWLYSVHTPLQAEKSKVASYRTQVSKDARHQNPTYAAMVEHMDDAVGWVLDTLRRLNLDTNTIVVFTSDNGGLIGNRGDTNKPPMITSNRPLRTGKGDVYEGGVRVPLIVRYPGKVAAGTTSSVPVISPDYYPTLVALAGIKSSKKRTGEFDGVSLADLLLGKKDNLSRDQIFWHYPHYHTEGATPYSAIRKGDWKLIEFFEDGRVELYNLAEDISEQNDLSVSQPKRIKELLADLKKWRKQVKAQMPTPNPAYDPTKESAVRLGAPL